MAKTYTQYMEQIESLKKEAEAIRHKEIQGVIERIREAIQAYGLTAADLGLTPRAPRGTAGKSVAKAGGKSKGVVRFKDDAGHTWSGRGPKPKWLKDGLASGKPIEAFKA